jgi:hypothetical protein
MPELRRKPGLLIGHTLPEWQVAKNDLGSALLFVVSNHVAASGLSRMKPFQLGMNSPQVGI